MGLFDKFFSSHHGNRGHHNSDSGNGGPPPWLRRQPRCAAPDVWRRLPEVRDGEPGRCSVLPPVWDWHGRPPVHEVLCGTGNGCTVLWRMWAAQNLTHRATLGAGSMRRTRRLSWSRCEGAGYDEFVILRCASCRHMVSRLSHVTRRLAESWCSSGARSFKPKEIHT